MDAFSEYNQSVFVNCPSDANYASLFDAIILAVHDCGSRIFDRYELFLSELPRLCASLNLDENELIYNDYTTLVVGWLEANPW